MSFSEIDLLTHYTFEKPDPVLLDVGAHHGTTARPFLERGWRVVAVEPETRNRAALCRQLGGFHNLTVSDAALSDTEASDVPFYTSESHTGIHTLSPFHASHEARQHVTTTTADHLLDTLGAETLSLLKVDVEGAEGAVLRGCDLERWSPEAIVLEYCDARTQNQYGTTHHDLARSLQEAGYAVFVFAWNFQREGEAGGHRFLGAAPYPAAEAGEWGNLIAIPTSRAQRFWQMAQPRVQQALERDLVQRHMRTAQETLKAKDPAAAAAALEALIAAVPNYLPAYHLLASLHSQGFHIDAWELEAAAALCQKALQIKGDDRVLLEQAAGIEVKKRQQLSVRLGRQQLDRFEQLHRGERCVIMGNGPSLNRMDLSFLKRETVFGLNRIYLAFERFDFVPRYLVCVNRFVLEQSGQELMQLPCTKFLSMEGVPQVYPDADTVIINPRHCDNYFSTDPRQGLCIGSTVTYCALQLAFYMGFEEVILIGVDHSFVTQGAPHRLVESEGGDPNHFDPNYFGKGYKWQLPDLDNSAQMYRIADAYFRAYRGKVIDATFEGHCPVFDKADYREVFKGRFEADQPQPATAAAAVATPG